MPGVIVGQALIRHAYGISPVVPAIQDLVYHGIGVGNKVHDPLGLVLAAYTFPSGVPLTFHR